MPCQVGTDEQHIADFILQAIVVFAHGTLGEFLAHFLDFFVQLCDCLLYTSRCV